MPRKHPYQPDWSSPPPWPGRPRLCVCGLPRDNQHHDLPDTDQAAIEAQARRYGERQ